MISVGIPGTKEHLFRQLLAKHGAADGAGGGGGPRVLVVGDGEEEWRAAVKLGEYSQWVQAY